MNKEHRVHLPNRRNAPRNSVVGQLAALTITIFISFPTSASTLLEPGFTETIIDTIAPATNGYGGMITDASGNLYFAANEADEVYIVPSGGSASIFGTNPGTTALGVTIIGTVLYSSYGSGAIYSQNLLQAAPVASVIANVATPMGMDVAPASFGGFGGQLVVGTTSGVSVVDPASGVETVLWNAGTEISDVAFILDGRLIVTRENTGELIELSAAGVPTPFAAGLGAPDGIAVHPGTGDIYVTDPNSSTLWRVAPAGSSVSAFATGAAVDGGYFPSPIAFSVDGTELFYGTRESGTTIYRISGFPSVTPASPPTPVPANDTLALLALILGLALAGMLTMRSTAAG